MHSSTTVKTRTESLPQTEKADRLSSIALNQRALVFADGAAWRSPLKFRLATARMAE